MNEKDVTAASNDKPIAEEHFDMHKFIEDCRQAQIAAGTYHPDLEAILPVLDIDNLSSATQHNNASVHGYILRERERCARVAESFRSIVREGKTGYEHAQGWTAAGIYIAAKIRRGERE